MGWIGHPKKGSFSRLREEGLEEDYDGAKAE